MSIWINRNDMSAEICTAIYNECVIIEIQTGYKPKGYTPKRVLMFERDITKQFFIVPFFIAKKYGFKPNNPCWRQVIFPYQMPDGTTKYLPEFCAKFRDYQIEILPEIIDYLKKHNSVIIGLPPGWGKTIIATYLLWMLGLLTIVIIKQDPVKNSWITTFKKAIPHARIWVVGENQPAEYDIILCMNERLHYIPDTVKRQVGTLIIDEVHTITSETQVMTFLGFQPKNIIFESATLEQSPLYKMATVCSGEHGVFKISTVPHYVFAVRTEIEGEEERKNGILVPSSVQKSLINNEIRKRIIQTIIYNHIEFRKFIIMQRVVNCIDETVQNINNLGITADSLYGSKKQYNQSQVLCGTYGKISTGFDEENACHDFYTNPEKSNTAFLINSIASKYVYEQSRGRIMRCTQNGLETENVIPWVIFLIDDNSNIKRNFNNLLPWIKETNGTVVYVDYKHQFIQQTTIKYQPYYSQGIYYRIFTNDEYTSLYNDGFYAGNEEEKKKNIVTLYKLEIVMQIKNTHYSEYKCYIATIHKCNLWQNGNTIIENNGMVYTKHPIFLKNIVNVSII